MAQVNLRLYSPRWGHDDTYSVELERDHLKITMAPREAKATWVENSDPVWSGEPLLRIMNNDSIYPPEITQSLFQRAWLVWRAGEIDDDQVAHELQLVADWINAVTQSKPNSDFWRAYF